MNGTIALERQSAPVALVKVSHEAKLNAFTMSMWEQLAETFEKLGADPSIRCIVLRCEGERAFSVGADIGEFAEHRRNKESARNFQKLSHRAFKAVEAARTP